jgi:cellulose synthase/poly-beta-1,6-N-acetylglucosamine synthase-like glycosyltransferase
MIAELVAATLALAAGAVLFPAVVLFAECVLGSLWPGAGSHGDGRRPSVAVLVPAHDEEPVIAETLARLSTELGPGDRVVVVADNCTDGTASVARAAGAAVVERNDEERRGKGFALERGVQFLECDPAEVVVVVDADCALAPGSLAALARAAARDDRPAQACYLARLPTSPRPVDTVSAFAFMVKNLVRPSGLARLGLPCQLMGTGMAFPWAILRKARLGTSAIVEDLELGLDLVIAGHPPRFCPEALVTSTLPGQASARVSQRRRWEHGHLSVLLGTAPRVLALGLARLDPVLLGVGLDLCVPPLSLLALAATVVLAASALAAPLVASIAPAIIAGVALALVFASALLAWLRYGRADYEASVLIAAPLYALRKLPLYLDFLLGRRQQAWVRTQREPQGAPAAAPDQAPGVPDSRRERASRH